MFMISVKAWSRKALIFFLVFLAVIILLIALRPPHDTTANVDEIKVERSGIATNEQRIAYLKSLGLVVSQHPIETNKVSIPQKLDDVYNRYNEIQKQAGFDLSKHRGEDAILYRYRVYNFEESNSAVYVNIFILEDTVIAGDLSSVELGGFMLPITYMIEKEK